LEAKIQGIQIDYFVAMPNHVHIIFILKDCTLGLGDIVRRLKTKVSHSFSFNV